MDGKKWEYISIWAADYSQCWGILLQINVFFYFNFNIKIKIIIILFSPSCLPPRRCLSTSSCGGNVLGCNPCSNDQNPFLILSHRGCNICRYPSYLVKERALRHTLWWIWASFWPSRRRTIQNHKPSDLKLKKYNFT